jgi:hypothetical protein
VFLVHGERRERRCRFGFLVIFFSLQPISRYERLLAETPEWNETGAERKKARATGGGRRHGGSARRQRSTGSAARVQRGTPLARAHGLTALLGLAAPPGPPRLFSAMHGRAVRTGARSGRAGAGERQKVRCGCVYYLLTAPLLKLVEKLLNHLQTPKPAPWLHEPQVPTQVSLNHAQVGVGQHLLDGQLDADGGVVARV